MYCLLIVLFWYVLSFNFECIDLQLSIRSNGPFQFENIIGDRAPVATPLYEYNVTSTCALSTQNSNTGENTCLKFCFEECDVFYVIELLIFFKDALSKDVFFDKYTHLLLQTYIIINSV